MAFTVQNDGGTQAGANAYADDAYYKAYWKDRGVVVTQGAGEIEAALIEAADYLDFAYSYGGVRLLETQTTEFPRDALYRRDDGVEITGVPDLVKEAACELAKRKIGGADLFPDEAHDPAGRLISKKTTAAVITTERTYSEHGGDSRLPSFPKVSRMLAPLLRVGGQEALIA